MESVLGAAAGNPLRYAAFHAMLPANFDGWIFKYHSVKKGPATDTEKYFFNSIEELIENMAFDIQKLKSFTCSSCGTSMPVESFIHHYNKEHNHEIILINVADQLGTNMKIFSNIIHYIVLKMLTITKHKVTLSHLTGSLEQKIAAREDAAIRQAHIERIEQELRITEGQLLEVYNSEHTIAPGRPVPQDSPTEHQNQRVLTLEETLFDKDQLILSLQSKLKLLKEETEDVETENRQLRTEEINLKLEQNKTINEYKSKLDKTIQQNMLLTQVNMEL